MLRQSGGTMIRRFLNRIGKRLGPTPIDLRHMQAGGGAFFTLPELLTEARDRNEAVIRSLCFSAYLGERTALCRVLGRYKMFVDTDDLSLSMHLMAEGFWEIWLTEAAARLIRPGMTAIDIGANLGYFSLLMSELVGETGSVHAIEPNPDIAHRLRRSLDINGFGARAMVHEVALTDRDGEALLAIPPSAPGGAHLINNPAGGAGTGVRARTLDSIPALAEADFIKIDVEGFEYAVWTGMRELVKSRRPLTIVMEYNGDCHPGSGAFLDEIAAAGFSVELLDHLRGIIPAERSEILSRPTEPLLLVLRR